jgi:hypothetical protein
MTLYIKYMFAGRYLHSCIHQLEFPCCEAAQAFARPPYAAQSSWVAKLLRWRSFRAATNRAGQLRSLTPALGITPRRPERALVFQYLTRV